MPVTRLDRLSESAALAAEDIPYQATYEVQGGLFVKALLFSDLHLDATFAIARDRSAARRRRQSLRDALSAIVDRAIEERVDVVLCGGDLYEQDRITQDTAEFLRSQFARLQPIQVLVAPGNHDWYGPKTTYARADWSSNVHIFTESHLAPFELVDGLNIWGGAHVKPAGTDSFLQDFKVDRGGVHLGLFHGSERNWLVEQGEGKVAHAPFDSAQIEASGLHHALLGHYHKPKQTDLFTYPGNPTPLAFGEDGDRGAVLLTIGDDGSVQRETLFVAQSEVSDVSLDLSGARSAPDIRERVSIALREKSGSLRVKLVGEVSADIDLRVGDLEDLGGHLDTLVFETDDLRRRVEIEGIAEEATVRGEFVRLVQAAGLEEREERQVIVTGLRALQGRDDLEVE